MPELPERDDLGAMRPKFQSRAVAFLVFELPTSYELKIHAAC